MLRIQPDRRWPLHNTAATRALEARAQASLAPHTLMQRAGLATARLARAIAPHARHVWVACGPGNNGGDGFEAARVLHGLGWRVSLSWVPGRTEPADARVARELALAAGLKIGPPPAQFDLGIDALLGLGGALAPDRPASALMHEWLNRMDASAQAVLAVDLPTGLNADTGAAQRGGGGPRHTLSLLSLKPGLFTAQGRDLAGDIWFDALGIDPLTEPPSAWLSHPPASDRAPKTQARHASHKGSFGDVLVVGGEHRPGQASMAGAALLAARAALHAGAGRVYVALLGDPGPSTDPLQPELMFRSPEQLPAAQAGQAVVAGCGGDQAVAAQLPSLLTRPSALVLDADALNAIAADPGLRQALARRGKAGLPTVLTPHPLEAARLLGGTAAEVQADRLQAARMLAEELGCVVVLKGSGTVMAAPGQPPEINFTGNALLASAGTGDVLAGMLGAALARGLAPHAAAVQAVWQHGRLADAWAPQAAGQVLTASELARGGLAR